MPCNHWHGFVWSSLNLVWFGSCGVNVKKVKVPKKHFRPPGAASSRVSSSLWSSCWDALGGWPANGVAMYSWLLFLAIVWFLLQERSTWLVKCFCCHLGSDTSEGELEFAKALQQFTKNTRLGQASSNFVIFLNPTKIQKHVWHLEIFTMMSCSIWCGRPRWQSS